MLMDLKILVFVIAQHSFEMYFIPGDYDGALALLTEMVYLIHERGNIPFVQSCRIIFH
jgi:hypothetical protein